MNVCGAIDGIVRCFAHARAGPQMKGSTPAAGLATRVAPTACVYAFSELIVRAQSRKAAASSLERAAPGDETALRRSFTS